MPGQVSKTDLDFADGVSDEEIGFGEEAGDKRPRPRGSKTAASSGSDADVESNLSRGPERPKTGKGVDAKRKGTGSSIASTEASSATVFRGGTSMNTQKSKALDDEEARKAAKSSKAVKPGTIPETWQPDRVIQGLSQVGTQFPPGQSGSRSGSRTSTGARRTQQ